MYLNAKTFYSFCYGTFSTAGLVETAVEQGISSFALCNINCTYDHWEFVKLCREAGIKPVLGVDIRNEDEHCYLLIARNNEGPFWINSFLSTHLIEKKEFPASPAAPPSVFVIYPYQSKASADLLVNERIGIKPYEIGSIVKLDTGDHYVIHQPVVVQDKDYYYLHCLLRAIDKNILISKLDKTFCCHRDDVFAAPGKLLRTFKRYPSLVTNTCKLLDACFIEIGYQAGRM